jgi:undecaprenyl-diphosphatase
MSLIEALILGIIQGLTEFLPVSSSGHLELGKAILGENSLGDENLVFTVVVHAATALSTIVIFRKDILTIFKGLFQFKMNEESTFSLKIILSMIPAAFVGVLFNDQIEALFTGRILLVGIMLLLTGVLLFLADKAKSTDKTVSYWHAIIIGIAQAIAIAPGISRSGATIGTSVLLGIDRQKAARFSFLMVVPLILGKIAKDVLDGALSTQSEHISVHIVGFLAAFISGLFACQWMIALVKKSQLRYFAFYCFIVGAISIAVSY